MLKRLTLDDFIKRANKFHNKKYNYSKVKFSNVHEYISIICPMHGEFKQRVWDHINTQKPQGCRKCYDEKRLVTKEKFIERCNIIHKNKYDYSKVVWIDTQHRVKIICPIHGEFEAQASSHMNDESGCRGCQYVDKMSEQKDIIKKFIEEHGNKYDYSKVIYKGYGKKVIIVCPTHGEFFQTPASHIFGNGCRICHESKGERKIRLWLLKNKIQYETQKKFDSCLGYRKRKLPFDFYIPSKNSIIEFDGKLHYEVWSKSENSIKRLKRMKETDAIKTNWCKSNGIKLLRIKYTEFDSIEKYLSEFLK